MQTTAPPPATMRVSADRLRSALWAPLFLRCRRQAPPPSGVIRLPFHGADVTKQVAMETLEVCYLVCQASYLAYSQLKRQRFGPAFSGLARPAGSATGCCSAYGSAVLIRSYTNVNRLRRLAQDGKG